MHQTVVRQDDVSRLQVDQRFFGMEGLTEVVFQGDGVDVGVRDDPERTVFMAEVLKVADGVQCEGSFVDARGHMRPPVAMPTGDLCCRVVVLRRRKCGKGEVVELDVGSDDLFDHIENDRVVHDRPHQRGRPFEHIAEPPASPLLMDSRVDRFEPVDFRPKRDHLRLIVDRLEDGVAVFPIGLDTMIVFGQSASGIGGVMRTSLSMLDPSCRAC